MTHPVIVLALYLCSGLGGGLALAYLLQTERTEPPKWKRWTVWVVTLCVGYLFAGYMGSIANSPELSSTIKNASFGLLALGFLVSLVAAKYRYKHRKTGPKVNPP